MNCCCDLSVSGQSGLPTRPALRNVGDESEVAVAALLDGIVGHVVGISSHDRENKLARSHVADDVSPTIMLLERVNRLEPIVVVFGGLVGGVALSEERDDPSPDRQSKEA